MSCGSLDTGGQRMRRELITASHYGTAAARLLPRTRRGPLRRERRLIFVVGSPRSGTTFLGQTLGRQPGVVDLDEVQPLKAAIPALVDLPEAEQARRFRRTLELVRLLGLVGHLRGVEQTPETSFVLRAAFHAYPQARALHMLRDGRDVACSLLERGWLSAHRSDTDDAHQPFGVHARFWVEPERRDEFARVSDARRAAWAWRRYVTAVRGTADERVLEVRYENLPASAGAVADHLGLDAAPLAAALAAAHTQSVGRWQRELTDEQVADVEAEAGDLLRELGYY
jgi:hypothetical protein